MAYSTIPKGSLYMNNKLYTGNGATQSITGVGFQPDWVWIKNRSAAESHFLQDAVRGSTKRLNSNNNNLEATEADGVTAFTSDGFNLGYTSEVNGNGNNIVSWNWKANGQGSSNTDGSIDTTYTSVNTTAGFSIVKYSANATAGATVGHGLGVIPKMIIVKELTGSVNDWVVYHASVGNTKKLILNESSAEGIDNFMNDTTPTVDVFSISNASVVNRSGSTYIAYCFAEKQGFSKFGNYTGNGSTNGTFVFTGFKPSFIIAKKTSGSGSWWMHDNKTSPFNVATQVIVANSSATETNGVGQMDFLSNGFKLRDTTDATNSSGGTYIYMAFASNPFVATSGTTAVPATAR